MVATRAFGDTGITVSEIGLGSWQLGRSAHWPDGPDEGEAIRIVHAALDAGVTFIDTAPGYADGQSELNIGAALRGRSDEVVICTKFGHTPEGTTNWAVEAIGPSVRRSAERLGVDHIDIVVLHNPPAEILDGTRSDHYEALEELTQAGLIRAYGASDDWSDDVDLVLARTPSRALEVRMSALYQEPWDAGARAYDEGVGTIIKVPLESGWLAGRYSTDSVFTGVRARWSRDDIALRAGLVDELPEPTWPDGRYPQMLHLDLTVPTVEEPARQHGRTLGLGARVLRDRSDDPDEPLWVYADRAGHPFCIFVARPRSADRRRRAAPAGNPAGPGRCRARRVPPSRVAVCSQDVVPDDAARRAAAPGPPAGRDRQAGVAAHRHSRVDRPGTGAPAAVGADTGSAPDRSRRRRSALRVLLRALPGDAPGEGTRRRRAGRRGGAVRPPRRAAHRHRRRAPPHPEPVRDPLGGLLAGEPRLPGAGRGARAGGDLPGDPAAPGPRAHHPASAAGVAGRVRRRVDRRPGGVAARARRRPVRRDARRGGRPAALRRRRARAGPARRRRDAHRRRAPPLRRGHRRHD